MKIRVKALLGDSVTSTVCTNTDELEALTNGFLGSSFEFEDISDQAINETLTKREQFAMAAMQGLIGHTVLQYVPEEAVELADALIKELDK